MISLAEWIGIKRNDPYYTLLARRWARGFVVTVAVGVVTGTAIGLQLSLLWPNFMQLAGQVISLPLFLETFAFFFEAIFLGIYLYTWDRFKKPIYHWLISIPVVIGSTLSAVFISTVNAFMNAPQGFDIVDGVLTNIEPLTAMFNPATPTKVGHVVMSAYLTSAIVLAAITAFHMLKGKRSTYYKKALKLTMTAGFIFAIGTAVIGDFSGKFLAEYQPEKLAAAEWHFETSENADLVVGGFLDSETEEVNYGLVLPNFLSILAHGNPSAEVMGLDQVPEDEIPPLYIHYLFDGMVGIGMFLAALTFFYVIALRLNRFNTENKWLLRLIVMAGPLSVFAIEFGWIFSEAGRQPWILWDILRTGQAATTSSNVGLMFILFLLLYIVLGTLCVTVLRKMFRSNPVENELEEIARMK